jgi:Leucine-rich repeat (LRR) protein
LKIVCLENNRLSTLEGSLSNMKFLQVLLLNDNKLRNLDFNLNFLKPLSFLKNLNLFGNPMAEEPEYRSRVIFSLPSLEDLDRHSNFYINYNRNYHVGENEKCSNCEGIFRSSFQKKS